MSPPFIKAQTFFGLKTDILGNAHFIADTEVIYPAGGVLVLHNFNRQEQRFINLPENQKQILSISISPNKQFIALSEKSEKSEKKNEKPSIKIYDLQSLELKKSLIIPFDEVTSTEFITVQFTWDSKYLVGIVGEPDWMLYYYDWEGGKIESQTKALNPNGQGKVAMVNCNPNDVNGVVVTGPQTFRLLNVSETVWRQWGWTKAENLIITSCMWLTPDKVMFGTKSGILMIVENGELKQNCCYRAVEVTEIQTKKTDDQETDAVSQTKDQEISSQSADDMEVRCLTVFPKGFAFSCKSGYVHMFEKESRFKWIKRNVFKVDDGLFRINEKDYIDLNIIQHVSVNDNQDTLIITTLKSQIYYVKLFEQHMNQVPEISFREMGEMLHHSKINGLAMCLWKPIFMTSGEADRSIRLWNYETRRLEFVKFYSENINCISLHPTGLFAVIGFTDKLCYMVVLIDDLYQMREFSIRNCKVCKFSNNGHMFAAVDNMTIKVFSSATFDNVYNLKGHSGTIRALSWAGKDDKIVSCGADGAIYEWCVMTARRLSEIIMKNNDFTGCSVSSDGKSFYIVGVDGEVKEARNDIIIRNLKIIGIKLDNIILAHSDMMLFVTGGKGTIVSIQFPLLDKAVFSEFHMHNKNVTAIALSYDDHTVISVSEDATMCIWKLDNSEGKAIVLSPDFQYSEEILINKNNLQEKLTNIEELSKRINEMETEHAFNLRQISMDHAESLRTLHMNYSKEIEELKEKIEKMKIDHSHEKNTLLDEITKTNNNHQKTTQEMDSDFNEKLIFEYEKYEMLEEEKDKMKKNYEKELLQLGQSKDEVINDLKNNYEAQLKEKECCIKELCEKNDLESREHEYIKQTIEDDADREILEIKSEYEAKLIEGKNLNVILKGETNVLKKKILASEKSIDDHKFSVSQLKCELENNQEFIRLLNVKISDLKKAIDDRDKIILEKERGMQIIKAENQTLEKHKFVLEFNIEELKGQIQPKNKIILEQQNQTQDLTTEINEILSAKEKIDLEMANLKEKLFAVQTENKKQLKKIYDLKTLLKKIHNETQELSSNIQNPKQLKTAVKELLSRYTHLKNPEEMDSKTENQENEKKKYYENIIASLNKKLENEGVKSKQENARIIRENLTLIERINMLREELQELHEQSSKMKILLGLPAARISPIKARFMIDKACTDYDNIEKEFKKKLEEKQDEIDFLKKQIEGIQTSVESI